MTVDAQFLTVRVTVDAQFLTVRVTVDAQFLTVRVTVDAQFLTVTSRLLVIPRKVTLVPKRLEKFQPATRKAGKIHLVDSHEKTC